MTLLFACRRCGAPVDVARRAALVPRPASSLLVDVACETCGHRALYRPEADGPPAHLLNKG
jgi:DNA-directed RNA polymerase subunit RPC12/RpoP